MTDGTPDVSGSDPWVQDSLEIFLDAGNAKNGPYRFDDTQIRISAENVTSFGTGDVAFQEARLESETASTDDGYVVEAAVSLLEYGGAGTFHGLDFQVNDGSNGVRTSIRTWADPTGLGYQSTARWGVAKLVETDARAGIADVIASLRGACTRSNAGPEAIDELERALAASYWTDGTHLRATTGATVFDHLAAAVTKLGKCVRKGQDADTVAQAARDLVAVSRLLALIAVEEAPRASRDREQALDPLRRRRRVRRGGDVRQRRQTLREGLGTGDMTGHGKQQHVDERQGGGTQR